MDLYHQQQERTAVFERLGELAFELIEKAEIEHPGTQDLVGKLRGLAEQRAATEAQILAGREAPEAAPAKKPSKRSKKPPKA
jgi:hypothetical protein